MNCQNMDFIELLLKFIFQGQIIYFGTFCQFSQKRSDIFV